MKRVVIDLDDTITRSEPDVAYSELKPRADVVDAIRRYREKGFSISIYTARNMRTYGSNLGEINAITLPGIIDWLQQHDIPYDEIFVGKPWCGHSGFYVDDKAIRPSEFVALSEREIYELIGTTAPQ
ncbi:capsular biosynthesis protein [Rhizobium deserti]|uniref:Capsular biosynthesis protein n=1 Tax=Rhizobium deserti TaxID=2547961 RepID=A0A4R5UIG0_9HYPH|nr:capsular biosynthesis protein [Rhizobium deserti]TDK36601.1 capsular biosynthesis protein [Rhizobium deserti]